MAGVKVYTTENCPYCRMVQAFLRKNDVEFEIVDVGKDREAARDDRALGAAGVPVTVFGDEVIVGFDARRLQEVFGTPAAATVCDVTIVGGGPAGLTAAVYCARKRMKTVLVAENIGGQAAWSWAIENYMGFSTISGKELIRKFEEQARGFDVHLELDSVTSVKKRTGRSSSGRPEELSIAPGRSSSLPGRSRGGWGFPVRTG